MTTATARIEARSERNARMMGDATLEARRRIAREIRHYRKVQHESGISFKCEIRTLSILASYRFPSR